MEGAEYGRYRPYGYVRVDASRSQKALECAAEQKFFRESGGNAYYKYVDDQCGEGLVGDYDMTRFFFD